MTVINSPAAGVVGGAPGCTSGTRRDVGNIRHVSNFASFRVGHNDSRVIQQEASGTIQFHSCFFVSCLRGNQIGFGVVKPD